MVNVEEISESVRALEAMRTECEKKEGKLYLCKKGFASDRKEGSILLNEQEDYVEEVVRYIRYNIEKSLTRNEIARHINLNEDYLSRLFKQKKGISLKEFVINEKMEVAKKLLQSTALPIGVIAEKVGYDNFSHFSSTYRKIMGKAPIEERDFQ